MPVTAIDPRTALVVIDLQKGIVGYPTVHPIADILQRAAALAAAFRAAGQPVVLVNVTGAPSGRTDQPSPRGPFPPGFAELVPELDQQPGDHLVTKQTRSAFTNTGLEALLRKEGVTQVVVIGVSTSAGVESTVRDAHALGFNAVVAVDAATDMNAETHHNSVERIFPRIAETGTTADILALLGQRAA